MQKKLKMYGYLTLSVIILVITTFMTIGIVHPPDIFVFEEEIAVTDHIWSSDGTKLAYLKSPNTQRHNGTIWVADWYHQVGASPFSARSALASKIRNNHSIYTGVMAGGILDWYGDWILFMLENETIGEDLPQAYHGMREIWKIKYDGTELTQLTFTGVNPNGIRSVWGSYYKNIGTVGRAHFIPGTNGELMYMSAHDGNGWWNPYVCTTDGSFTWYELGNQGSRADNSFTFGMSPTGNKLLWGDASYWNYKTTLKASNVDGSGIVTLGAFPYRTTPLVLADGNTVIYQHVGTGGITLPPGEPNPPAAVAGNLYVMNIDGTNKQPVIDDDDMHYWANYNPVDPQAFLMISNRSDGNMHIFTINTDGTGIVQLTEGPYNDYAPIYSPDGQYILYLRLPEDYIGGTQYPDPYELVVVRNVGKHHRWRWRMH